MLFIAVILTEVLLQLTAEAVVFPRQDNNSSQPIQRRSNEKNQNLQSLLRQASFQSLTKFTGFTESLDERIERDRILWERIRTADFIPNDESYDESHIKVGVMVDKGKGKYEFKQSNKSMYKCTDPQCISDGRLLGLWKVTKREPDQIRIRMKISLNPDEEDLYIYSPKHGLKKQTSEPQSIESKSESQILPEYKSDIRRQDFDDVQLHHNINRNQNFQQNIFQNTGANLFNNFHIPEIPVLKPNTVQNTLGNIGLRNTALYTTSKVFQDPTISAVLSQFQTDKTGYTGFLPSYGPSNDGLVYKSIPIFENQEHDFNPKFISKYKETLKDYFKHTSTPTNFKASSEFIQYSEQDPFIPSEHHTINLNNDAQLEFPYKVQTSINPKFPTSINVAGISFGHDNSYLASSQGHNKTVHSNPTLPKPPIKFTYSPTSTIDYQHPLQSTPSNFPQVTEEITDNIENIDFTGFFTPWNTFNNKEKDRGKDFTHFELSVDNVDKLFNDTFVKEVASSDILENDSKISNITTISPINSDNDDETKLNDSDSSSSLIATNKTENAAQGSENKMEYIKLKNKSPEEIVSSLTAMGLKNSTESLNFTKQDMLKDQNMESSQSKYSTTLKEATKSLINTRNQYSARQTNNPTSLVVNRISKSYSYKTGRGNIEKVKLPFRINSK